jgi:hypothetical protein
MRGCSQPHLIQASDSCYYVVKFWNNPQGRRILINEFVAVALLGHLHILAPEMALVWLSEDFLSANPEISIHLGAHRLSVPPGWHFGSRFPGDPDRLVVYDFIPNALLTGVVNLDQFLGILVFDKWVGNADGRQAVFYRRCRSDGRTMHPPDHGFVACMIDQGLVFNGMLWNFPDAPLYGVYPRPLVYESVRSVDDFRPWLERVAGLPEEITDQAHKEIPAEWLDDDEDALRSLLQRLFRRRQRVPDLLEDCRRAKASLFPNWR